MKPGTSWLVGTAILVAVLFALTLIVGRLTHCDSRYAVRLSGRLVDARTGLPLADAWVMTFPRRMYANDPEWVDLYRRETRDYLHAQNGPPAGRLPVGFAPQCGGSTTDADGRFTCDVGVPWSWNELAFGIPTGAREPQDRHGIAVLRIDVPGRVTAIVDVPEGRWEETGKSRWADLRATWDLGDVAVPLEGLK